MPDEFAAIVLVTIFGVPAAAWVAVRMMEHLERMEMIRRGMIPPPYRYQIALLALDNGMGLGRGIMLGTLAILLLAGLSFIVSTDEILLPGLHSYTGGSWWPAALGLALLAIIFCRRASRRSTLFRRLRHKTIRDAGASLKLP